MSEKSVIIVAGGVGKRMNGEIPKQFLILGSKPVLCYTIEQFYRYDPEIQIILVLPEQHISIWRELCQLHDFKVAHKIVTGGQERFFSVKNGISHVKGAKWVAVHDGVRPLVSINLITQCFNQAMIKGSAIPVISPSETVRYGSHAESKTIERDKIFLVQTPQVFRYELISKAYEADFQTGFTDDASVMESSGLPVFLTEGDPMNIKITRPYDLNLCHFYQSDLN